MPPYLIALDLSGRSALVVGLGPVGRRKARGLVEAGARVVGVDPAGGVAIEGVERRIEPYEPIHLSGMALAFAAAPSEVNRRVVRDARAAGVWVNSASDPGRGDFAVPAVWRDGPVSLGVSTTGSGPAIAAMLRDRAAGAVGPGAAILADVVSGLRRSLIASVPDPAERRRILVSWADPSWLEAAEREGPAALRSALEATLRPPS